MKAKNIALLVLAVVIAVMLVSTVSFADARNWGRNMCFASGQNPYFAETGMRPGGIVYLNFSQEQISKINQLRLDFQKASLELKKEKDLKRLEIKELITGGSVDIEKIKTKWEEIAQIQTELRVKSLENQLKIKEILTPEQLEKFNLNCLNKQYGMGMRNFDNFSRGSCFRRNRR